MGLGRCPQKCDTNPLTLPKHTCYYPHRSNTNLTISRRNQKPREAPETQQRTQRPSPSQRPSRRPAAQAGTSASGGKRRHLLFPRAPAHPSPYPSGDGRSTILNGMSLAKDPCRNSPAHAGLNTRASRPLENLPRRSLRRSPYTQRRQRENARHPSEWPREVWW